MILFSFFLLTVTSRKKLSNQLFAAFLLITAFDLSGLFLGEWLAAYPHLLLLKTASSLLQMPLFYLYVLSVCFSDFALQPRHALHGVLFLLFLFMLKVSAYSSQSLLYFRVVGEMQYFAYIGAIFYALKQHRTVYLENYSNPDDTGYKWLFQVTTLFCIAHMFVLVKTWAPYLGMDLPVVEHSYVVISMSALLITCWFVLKALYSPQLFTGVVTALAPLDPPRPKRKLPAEQDAAAAASVKRLTSFMENEKPYLDFELTLQKLAAQCGMPEKDLSLLINQQLGKHFFDFINDYRIAAARAILADPRQQEVTVLEILYQVGFNSKSSFYTAFRKVTNQTPTAYRKAVLAS